MNDERQPAQRMEVFACLPGRPQAGGILRREPADFQVDEVLGFAPDGEGEHWLLRIEKTGCNTGFVARNLARACAVPPVDIGYCGLKDRHARTRQWFSVRLTGREAPALTEIECEGVRVLETARHGKKLRRGIHAANHFDIMLREVRGARDQIDERLAQIAREGFPNYFGEQRFGHDGRNVEAARESFAGRGKRLRREQRSLYWSAARGWLFNRVLSARIRQGRWSQLVAGDVLMLEGSHSVFAVDQVDAELEARLAASDVHLTGPLWGQGRSMTGEAQTAWERDCLEGDEDLCEGLVRNRLAMQRRALRVRVPDLTGEWAEDGDLRLRFALSPGSYATSLVRELLEVDEADR